MIVYIVEQWDTEPLLLQIAATEVAAIEYAKDSAERESGYYTVTEWRLDGKRGKVVFEVRI